MDTAAVGEITVVEEAIAVAVWAGAGVGEVAVVVIKGRDKTTVHAFTTMIRGLRVRCGSAVEQES